MSQDIADMPGIDAAMERFESLQTATNANDGSNNATSTVATTDSKTHSTPATRIIDNEKPHAEAAANGEAQDSVSSSEALAKGDTSTNTNTDTPAAAGGVSDTGDRTTGQKSPQSTVHSPQSKTTNDSGLKTQDSGLATKTRYARAQERLEKTWEVVNKRKTELHTQAQQLEEQRLSLERDKAQFETVRRQAEAEQPSATPEQAVQAAQLRRRDADALRMQAKRAEDAGRYQEAQRFNKQADKAESLADDLGEYAEQLRKSPPMSMQQRAQQFEQARKQWTLEACNAFPELGKNGSRLQQAVAQHLNALAKQDPQLLVHPSLIYHVARLADAEVAAVDLKAVAARVPVLEKEAESLRARIKELEAAATPVSNGSVNRLAPGPSQDDYTSLRRDAEGLGSRSW